MARRPAINGERFRLSVEHVLVPTLKPIDIVVMDNLGSHEGKSVGSPSAPSAQSSSSCLPNLNPLEQLIA